ncbi:protein PIGMENT DEFECTIVE 338, chloroplastic [Solanum dulcamara]|uniref:protein PIGMENT DEFECTIVE 338, chloroplastic n=1 Tax=Solanum dulcamara TaxID=45834 RepID=UPI002485875B|nr:protein PIGMENT DEFECTIVE 338, chloroplastic [Solanum dulcamara]
MPLLLLLPLPCKSFSIFNPILPLNTSVIYNTATQILAFPLPPKYPFARTPKSSKNLSLHWNSQINLHTHVSFCSKNEIFEEFRTTHLAEMPESEELELLNKPYLKQINNGVLADVEEEQKKVSKDEVLEPFYKLFKPRESNEEESDTEQEEEVHPVEEESKKVSVEYYEPKPGDLVVGVVVSGNDNKLDVSVGADLLGTMLTKDVLPLYDKEMDYLLCDLEKDAEEFLVRGKMGIVSYDEAVSWESTTSGKPVVEPGTVLFAEVLGRTLSGRPLLSTRRLFRRIAWHRVRQIKQLNEPIEVKITEWNTGGLLTRIEGLRAFLPKAELMNRVNSFTDLKENVGRRINVLITRINEETNDLILSEKEAWQMLNLQEGTLVEGTVKKLFPFGAQIRLGETNRSGLLHISNVTQGKVTSMNNLLAVDEKVKVMVVRSMFPDKISLSIANLESEPGLFLSDKERVFSEAKEMAKKYRQSLRTVSATKKLEPLPTDRLPFEDEENMYANWNWFKFERDNVNMA